LKKRIKPEIKSLRRTKTEANQTKAYKEPVPGLFKTAIPVRSMKEQPKDGKRRTPNRLRKQQKAFADARFVTIHDKKHNT